MQNTSVRDADPSTVHALTRACYRLSEFEFHHPREDVSARRNALRAQIERTWALEPAEFQIFLRRLVASISSLCQDPSLDPEVNYRAFEVLDDVLRIDYRDDQNMSPSGSERLYERAGAGVQTAYSSILKVLEYLRPREGAHLVDLGSGFGRVGLAAGLWRADLRCSGFEYVDHRVHVANAVAARAGLGDRVRFLRQDLADPAFRIPAADIYYLYDPFTESTYRRVIAELAERGRERPTVVVAKAGAREGFRRWTDPAAWSDPETLDHGTLTIFRSHP